MMRTQIKSGLIGLLTASGLSGLSRVSLRDSLLVLCYHGVVERSVSDRFGYGNTVSVGEFRGHLQFLAKHFRPVSLADVIGHRNGQSELPPGAALVTFDDGYRNNLTNAAPVLREVGVPGGFFISTGYIGTGNILWTDEVVGRIVGWPNRTVPLPDGSGECDVPAGLSARRQLATRLRNHCKRLEWAVVSRWIHALRDASPAPPPNAELFDFMTWDEVRKLHSLGFDIGSHTVNHPILTRIPPAELASELTASKVTIERELGILCEAIAYPNGGAADVSEDVFRAAGSAGYKLGFTIAERHSPAGENPLSISRLCIQGHLPMSSFTYRVDGLQRLLRMGGS